MQASILKVEPSGAYGPPSQPSRSGTKSLATPRSRPATRTGATPWMRGASGSTITSSAAGAVVEEEGAGVDDVAAVVVVTVTMEEGGAAAGEQAAASRVITRSQTPRFMAGSLPLTPLYGRGGRRSARYPAPHH